MRYQNDHDIRKRCCIWNDICYNKKNILKGEIIMFQKDYNTLKQIINFIDDTILNRELHHYILDHINNVVGKEKGKVTVTPTMVSIENKKEKTKFCLKIEPSCKNVEKISTSNVLFNGRFLETKEITFVNKDCVEIMEQEHSVIVYSNSNQVSSTSKKVHKRIYQNNQLSYEYEYETSVDGKLEKNVDLLLKKKRMY